MYESNSDSDDENMSLLEPVPPNPNNLIPEKSRKTYEKAYEEFKDWKIKKCVTSFSEDVLLTYFQEMSDTLKWKSSTLWTKYSMLKCTLCINHAIDLMKYSKLLAFLKSKAKGYEGKKSKTFSPEQIKQFLDEAPNLQYLATKVALIIGITGACRRHELYNLRSEDVQIFGNTIIVNIYNNKSNINRTFSITGRYYELIKQYIELRPKSCCSPGFFMNYISGKCTPLRMGINKFGSLGKVIAKYLSLANPELYTGHCFRRTSATVLVDSGGEITNVKRFCRRGNTTETEFIAFNT